MKLNFPDYDIKLSREGERIKVFDEIRRKWMVLTPEEWVRQHLLCFLRQSCGVPVGVLSVEKGLKVNNVSKRIDVAVYDRSGNPVMICECKRPEIKLDEKVFEQIFVYNLPLGVEYLLVTNGLKHLCGRLRGDDFEFVHSIPTFDQLNLTMKG